MEIEPTNEENKLPIDDEIKRKEELTVPILVLEFLDKDEIKKSKWDQDDLYSFCSKFGKIIQIEILSSKALIVFEKYLDAYSCLSFFKKEDFYVQGEKEKILMRWYDENKDEKIIEEIYGRKVLGITNGQKVQNINKSMLNQQSNVSSKRRNLLVEDEDDESANFYNFFKLSMQNESEFSGEEHFSTNANNQIKTIVNFTLSPKAKNEFKGLIELNRKRGINLLTNSLHLNQFTGDQSKASFKDNFYVNNPINDKLSSIGKLCCTFFVQIENEPGFQVSNRLLGAKGSNIKRIIEFCSKGANGTPVPDAVKIRLRGKGSNYNEFCENNETEEKLNIYVCSKYVEKYRKACTLVQELLINVYEEYKRYCERNGIEPHTNLTIQKVENITTNE